MSKITGLDRPNDLLIKLLREGSRLRFETDDNNRIDHFFNFSVTAESLRDWCAEALCLNSSKNGVKNLKKTIDKSCNEIPALLVARDIANSVKHFNIRKYEPEVENAKSSVSKQVVLEFRNESNAIDIALDKLGKERTREVPSFEIVFNDGSDMGLDKYIMDTVLFWFDFFDKHAIYRDCTYQASFPFYSMEAWPILLALNTELPEE